VSWPLAEARGQAAKGVEALPDESIHSDPVSLGLVLSPLQGREQALGARDSDGDKAELAQDAGPLLSADSLDTGEVLKDVGQSLLAVRGQLDGLSDGVHYPAQDELASGPAAVPFQ